MLQLPVFIIPQLPMASGTRSAAAAVPSLQARAGFLRAARRWLPEALVPAVQLHLALASVIADSAASEALAADGAAVATGEDAGIAAGVGAASDGAGIGGLGGDGRGPTGDLAGATRDGITLAWPGAPGILTGTTRGGAGIITILDTTWTTQLAHLTTTATRSIPALRTRRLIPSISPGRPGERS